MSICFADWPAPKNIIAGFTTRQGGQSKTPFASFNMGLHVGDCAADVQANRQKLMNQFAEVKSWQWLDQVHGVQVVQASDGNAVLEADAVYSTQRLQACTVMTADCLPILLCDKQGEQVAAIHAGWRSLCYGIIENTVATFKQPKEQILAYFGPAIGAESFQVGEDVRAAFLTQNEGERSKQAFVAQTIQGKYLADLYQLAAIRLQALGITAIYGGEHCTYQGKEQFYSYRRDGQTGRMVSFICIG